MGRVANAPLRGGARCVMTTSRRSRYAVPHPEGRFPFFHRTRDTTEGREARNFDVVASLAGISDLSLDAPEAQLIERIKSLLAFLRAWDMFKRAEREE